MYTVSGLSAFYTLYGGQKLMSGGIERVIKLIEKLSYD